MSGCHSSLGSETVVTYFFCGEEIPYRRMMKTHSLTLGHFKEQLRKKGNYRYTLFHFQLEKLCLVVVDIKAAEDFEFVYISFANWLTQKIFLQGIC